MPNRPFQFRRVPGLALAAVALLAVGGARAAPADPVAAPDGPIPTAAGAPAGGAPAPSPIQDPLRLSDHRDLGVNILRSAPPCGPVAASAGDEDSGDAKPDKRAHGEVFAGVGTHGYREVGGVVCVPLGDKASATIAIDVGHMDGWGRRH